MDAYADDLSELIETLDLKNDGSIGFSADASGEFWRCLVRVLREAVL